VRRFNHIRHYVGTLTEEILLLYIIHSNVFESHPEHLDDFARDISEFMEYACFMAED
jgi:hypothetical protein